jgi:hypothetical protein
MPLGGVFTTAEIKALFAEEISAAGGTVSDSFDDGVRLFTRSLLPKVREVRTADQVQGGVALRTGKCEVWVHPYVFRQVCRNGAIMAQAIQSRQVEIPEFTTPEDAAEDIQVAIRACCADEAFSVAAQQMRSAREVHLDAVLNMLPFLSRMPAAAGGQIVQEILDRFFREADQTRFGLMNAVTSVARDTRNPEVRWHLEELGGGIAAGLMPVDQPDDAGARAALVG